MLRSIYCKHGRAYQDVQPGSTTLSCHEFRPRHSRRERSTVNASTLCPENFGQHVIASSIVIPPFHRIHDLKYCIVLYCKRQPSTAFYSTSSFICYFPCTPNLPSESHSIQPIDSIRVQSGRLVIDLTKKLVLPSLTLYPST
jgi:hypothetical protein